MSTLFQSRSISNADHRDIVGEQDALLSYVEYGVLIGFKDNHSRTWRGEGLVRRFTARITHLRKVLLAENG